MHNIRVNQLNLHADTHPDPRFSFTGRRKQRSIQLGKHTRTCMYTDARRTVHSRNAATQYRTHNL